MRKRRFGVVSLLGIVGFFLAFAPVLDPYIILEIGSGFTIKINDLIMLILAVFCFSKSYKFEKKTGFLCFWLIGIGIISVIANVCSSTDIANSMKNLFVWFIYAICLMYLWKTPCREEFMYWVEIIAIIASLLVILQFVGGNIGISVWDGRIPGVGLGKYEGWAGYIDKNTGDIRPNGFFQEASYLGIYVSIAYAQAFKEEKIKRMILYAVAMLLTTSIVAIASLVVITLVTLILQRKIDISSKMTRRVILISAAVLLVIVIASASNEAVRNSFSYIMKRLTNFSSDLTGTRMSSTKYRIAGHIALFNSFTPIQKMIGVGIAQYASYFNVTSYGNVWVTTILNCGFIGFLYLLYSVLSMLKIIKKENIIYYILFFIVISFDWQWFSWYFFALISACILNGTEDEKHIQETIE